ncbi:MAG TPA: LOG family protein [Candidatus Woesebacteria bacterium]|nr:LOG family protein [Candidatus Woesebacteria bacterium]
MTTNKIIKRVAFFGDAELTNKDEQYNLAVETAKLLAENNYIIVNGGGPGIMKAATIGAKQGGGKVEIVVLDPSKQPENYEGIDKENYDLADEKIVTNNYPERLNKLIEIADAFVIFNGGVGTLSEVGMVWEQAKFEYKQYEPLVFVGEQWKKVVDDLTLGMNYEDMEKKVIRLVKNPEEVLKALKRAEN